MRKNTIEIGDLVQIRANAKYQNGRLGRIIGNHLIRTSSGNDLVLYTVQFSDTESFDFEGHCLALVRSTKPHKSGKKDITYETR